MSNIESPQELFAKRLKQARENKGMSQRGAAKLLGFSQSALSLWELGKNMPELNVMVKLAEFYGVPFDWLSGTAVAPKVKTAHEIFAVPMLEPHALVRWDMASAEEVVQSSACYLAASAAAVRVTTDSLPSVCRVGDIAIVERDQRLVENGLYYIQVVDSGRAPILRRCSIDGPEIYFVAEVGVPAIRAESGIKVVGRVREIVRRFHY